MSPFTNKNLKKIDDLVQALKDAEKIDILSDSRLESVFAAGAVRLWLTSMGKSAQVVVAGLHSDDLERMKEAGVDITQDLTFRTLKINARDSDVKFEPLNILVQDKEIELSVVQGADERSIQNLKVSLHSSQPDMVMLFEDREKFDVFTLPDTAIKVNIARLYSASGFSHIELFNPTASSTSELVAEVLFRMGVDIKKESATLLYAGLSLASGNFQSPRVTGTTFEIGAWLLEKGGDLEKAVSFVFPRLPLATIKFFGSVLDYLKIVPDLPSTIAIMSEPASLNHADLGQTLWNVQNWLGSNVQSNLIIPINSGSFQAAVSMDELLDQDILINEVAAQDISVEHHGPLEVVFFSFACGSADVMEKYLHALRRAYGMI